MRITQTHVGSTFDRVRQLIVAHPDIAQAVNQTVGWQQLEVAVTALRSATVTQAASPRDIKGEAENRRRLERTLEKKYITPTAKFARGQLKGTANFAGLAPSVRKLHGKRLANAARGIIKAAAPFTAQMEVANFPAGFMQDFANAANAVEASVDSTANSNRERVSGTKAIKGALRDGRAAVQTLDSVISHLILGNEPLEAEWRVAKRITQNTGRRTKPVVPPMSTPTTITSTTSTAPVTEAPAVPVAKAA